jgi:hypothetical protein
MSSVARRRFVCDHLLRDARREANEPMFIVILVDLAIDPAVAERCIDRVGFG